MVCRNFPLANLVKYLMREKFISTRQKAVLGLLCAQFPSFWLEKTSTASGSEGGSSRETGGFVILQSIPNQAFLFLALEKTGAA
jgi:hypothetical protein